MEVRRETVRTGTKVWLWVRAETRDMLERFMTCEHVRCVSGLSEQHRGSGQE